MRTLDRLAVARRIHALTIRLYGLTERFPARDRFGLASQLRRACVAAGSNIAEGDASNSNREFARYLDISKASMGEVDYQLFLARDLGYIGVAEYKALAEEVTAIRAMLVSLATAVRARPRLKSAGPD